MQRILDSRLLAGVVVAVAVSGCGSARSTGPADTVPPVVSLSVHPFPVALDSDYVVDGSVQDAGGVASLTIDGTAVALQGGNTFSLTLHSPAKLGPVTIAAVATDRAGNRVDTNVVVTTRAQRYDATVTGLPGVDSVLEQPEFVLTVAAPTQVAMNAFIFVDGTTGSMASAQTAPFMFTSPVLREGPHSIEVIITPDAGVREYDTTFTLITHFPVVNYQATVLPTLGGDYDAIGTDMNDSGVVVGWSQDWITGVHRPVRWVNDTIGPLPLDSATMGWADAIDARGDIVGKVMRVDSAFEAAAVWIRGDTLRALAGTPEARRINSAGQVLTKGGNASGRDPSLYDIATGTFTTIWPKVEGSVVDLDERGDVVGFTNTAFQFASPLSFGAVSIDSLPPLPAVGGAVFYEPVDMNDSGETLLTENGRWILSTRTGAQFATPFIGPVDSGSTARLNNTGLVAGPAPDKTIYIWDRTAGVTRLVSTDPGWGFDAVYRISDSGVILAHGQNGTTGARGPVVLTPIK